MSRTLPEVLRIAALTAAVSCASLSAGAAQSVADEAIRITAVEALVMSSPERAIPLIGRVLDGEGSDELKTRALFVLGQFGGAEANELLFQTVETGSPELRVEALRAIGIAGDRESMERLRASFFSFDAPGRMATMEAYMIAGYVEGLVAVADTTDDPMMFDQAVNILAAMGEVEVLRGLKQRFGASVSLVEAYMVSGDVEALEALIREESDPEVRAEAVRALGLTGGERVGALLLTLYREEGAGYLREAARDALFLSGQDQALMELYRSSADVDEKRELLETLIRMDSPEVWSIVEEALVDGE